MKKFRDILILGKCNLDCWYCERPNHLINEAKVLISIDKIMKRFNTQDYCFRFECRGEITLYKEIMDYVINLAKDGYKIEILTNGVLLQEVLPVCSQVGVNISLDGHTADMNKHRGLSREQVDRILDNIIKYDANVQMVYYEQSIDEVNGFIDLLQNRGFNKTLYIFPCIIGGKMIAPLLPYKELRKAAFVQPEEYYRRWEYIYENKERKDFVCDFAANGYVYYIFNNHIKMLKCDGSPLAPTALRDLSDEEDDPLFSCGCCINHYEFNNARDFVMS